MRKWGVIVSMFYALAVVLLLVPGAVYLWDFAFFNDNVADWLRWIPIGVVLSGQVLLLFLSVDTSFRRLKPRAHILATCTTAAMFFALLTSAAAWSLFVAVFPHRQEILSMIFFWGSGIPVWLFLWLVWGIAFYRHVRDSPGAVTRVTSWLLKGSVLELLVAVPCHVIVRRRHDCSAPAVTSFGIVAGIAIMLLSFGPSVLLLYKKRLDTYAVQKDCNG